MGPSAGIAAFYLTFEARQLSTTLGYATRWWAISTSLLAPSRSLFHQGDECGFNGIQAFQDRLGVIEIALFR